MLLYGNPYNYDVLKVKILLNALHIPYQYSEVQFCEREELCAKTGAAVVPALVAGQITLTETDAILSYLLNSARGKSLLPPPLQGPIMAYAEWCDRVLLETSLKLAAPGIARHFSRKTDRALFTMFKERKFGKSCLTNWEQQRKNLSANYLKLLTYTAKTLEVSDFIFGPTPVYADITLVAHFSMLKFADTTLMDDLGSNWQHWIEKFEGWCQSAKAETNAQSIMRGI